MTPKTRSPAEKTVVWSTTTARINNARRRRGSQVTVGPPCFASSARRRPQHLHVVEVRDVDQRLDEDVLLEVTAGFRGLAHGPDGYRGRERAFLLTCGVDDLTLGHVRIGIDEVGPHRVAVASSLHHAGRAALLDLDADTRLRVRDEEHGGAVAGDLEHAPDQSCPRHDRHVHAYAVALTLPDLDRELEVARRAVDDRGGDRGAAPSRARRCTADSSPAGRASRSPPPAGHRARAA